MCLFLILHSRITLGAFGNGPTLATFKAKDLSTTVIWFWALNHFILGHLQFLSSFLPWTDTKWRNLNSLDPQSLAQIMKQISKDKKRNSKWEHSGLGVTALCMLHGCFPDNQICGSTTDWHEAGLLCQMSELPHIYWYKACPLPSPTHQVQATSSKGLSTNI